MGEDPNIAECEQSCREVMYHSEMADTHTHTHTHTADKNARVRARRS